MSTDTKKPATNSTGKTTNDDALIVKSYAMSAPKTGFVIPLGGGSAAADESKTR